MNRFEPGDIVQFASGKTGTVLDETFWNPAANIFSVHVRLRGDANVVVVNVNDKLIAGR